MTREEVVKWLKKCAQESLTYEQRFRAIELLIMMKEW